MASVELGKPSYEAMSQGETRARLENGKREETDLNDTRNGMKKNGNRTVSSSLPMLGCGCFRVQRDEEGNLDIDVVNGSGERPQPTHLLIMVNGLFGSAKDWKYAAEAFLKMYPEDIVVHCSKRNYSTLTLDGVDVMGERLAEEILSVIRRHSSVQKISFVCHSLGGLIARYAIAKLYEQDALKEDVQVNGEYDKHGLRDQSKEEEFKGKIAGLEPINFITCATPHLGSRGHKQVPMCCGFYALEKVAVGTSYFFGRTGRQLFLIDKDSGKCPLLFHMAGDREDLKFLSALQSFRRRVTYANARYDNVVGWCTSSIRRHKELPKLKGLSGDSEYPYIVNVEMAKISSPELYVPSEAEANGYKKAVLEEEMIKGLSSVSWERVDVDFHKSKQRNNAHLTIQVNRYKDNSDGACVIQHMIDNFIL
ncbi:putative lipase YDL109C [Cucurbita pepo subsp. pepo]|uniref:putative lipase YDL109C n=1 Tax=Cucurbita pepo subsp. pepo TaxID=3664 RepID=UPI000C9D8C02|nr:putative lipase YDL109C [Cucurbita pepo subsp. pepo]